MVKVLLWAADNGVLGNEPWYVTAGATQMSLLKDIEPGPGSSNPRPASDTGFALASVRDTAFFAARTATAGEELWATDLSVSGTRMVLDGLPGPDSGNPEDIVAFEDRVYYELTTPGLGDEVWSSDGTAPGTGLVRDIQTGAQGSFPEDFVAVGDRLLFRASDAASGSELWSTDGTDLGTRPVKDINPGTGSSMAFGIESGGVLGSDLLFAADDGVTGYELYRTDGTEAGTVLVRDINPGAGSSVPTGFTKMGDAVYFAAQTEASGFELWRSDGTAAGTRIVKDIYSGTSGAFANSSSPRELTNLGGTLVFRTTTEDGRELWASDGTGAGTRQLADILPGGDGSFPSGFVRLGDTAIFSADDGSNGRELWITDGTAVGTALLKDINPGAGSSGPGDLVKLGGKVYFNADDGVHGRELWVTDGTAAGTELFEDLRPGPAGSNVRLVGLADIAVATERADVLIGTAGRDVIDGKGGADRIRGLDGADVLRGSAGRDDINGNRGNDAVGGGSGNDKVKGGPGNDAVAGGSGNDRLWGDSGRDDLDGGRGKDILRGGEGADIFLFEDVADSRAGGRRDVIKDFEQFEDRIDLSGLDATEGRPGMQSFRFIEDDAFTGHKGELRSAEQGGKDRTIISADTDGDGRADFQIELSGAVELGRGDFLL